jgi:hypothetical protein
VPLRATHRLVALVALSVAGLLAVTAAACSGSHDKADDQHKHATPAASPTPSSRLKVTMPTTGLSTRQLPAANAVLTYWIRYGAAVSTGDLKDSGLSFAVSASSGVANTQRVVDALNHKKQRYQGSLVITVRAVDVGPQTATVDACVDQRRSLLTTATGTTVAEPGKPGVLPIAHTLVHRDGRWLVDRLNPLNFSC